MVRTDSLCDRLNPLFILTLALNMPKADKAQKNRKYVKACPC